MKKVEINQKIIKALGLSKTEATVFEVLLEYSLPNSVQKITKKCKLPRMTVFDALRRLEKRNLAERVRMATRKRDWWKYKKGLEFVDKNRKATLPIIGEVR